eukprot:UN30598
MMFEIIITKPQFMLESVEKNSCIVIGLEELSSIVRSTWTKNNWTDFQISPNLLSINGYCAPTDVDPNRKPWFTEGTNILQQILNPMVCSATILIKNPNIEESLNFGNSHTNNTIRINVPRVELFLNNL